MGPVLGWSRLAPLVRRLEGASLALASLPLTPALSREREKEMLAGLGYGFVGGA
jgi:hypothetical protein